MDILINSEQKRREAIGGLVILDLANDWKFKVTKVSNKRTLTQNRALHLFFKHISEALTGLDIYFHYNGLKGLEMEIPYNETLVKETIWKPLQKTMFDIDSTTDLDTFQINEILDVLTVFFAKNKIQINFPSQIDLIAKEFENKGYY